MSNCSYELLTSLYELRAHTHKHTDDTHDMAWQIELRAPLCPADYHVLGHVASVVGVVKP